MKKIPLKKKLNLISSQKFSPIKIIRNDIKSGLANTKFEEKINEENKEININDNNKIIKRLQNIFISKTKCSKFNYHPLINYSIGQYDEYSLYLKTAFVEISYFKRGKINKIEKTYFNPNSISFGINFQNLTFFFFMYSNKVQIILNLKETFQISAISDLKKIRKNCVDLTNNNYENKLNSTFTENSYREKYNENLNDKLKNPFEELKDKKIICFSCKKKDEFYEVKYGYDKVFLDGFYEAREDIKLSFKNPKYIFIHKGRLIFLEIKFNCDLKKIKNEIFKKIQILKLLGLIHDEVFFLGIIYNNFENEKKMKEEEKYFFEEQNFKVYIFYCDNYFLEQKINIVKRVFSKDSSKQINILNNTQYTTNNINEINNNGIDKNNTRNMVLQIQKSENLNEIKKYTGKNLKQTFEIKRISQENHNNKPSSLYSISNFSIFDDDILYYQMNFE